jgi:hypothetical protein
VETLGDVVEQLTSAQAAGFDIKETQAIKLANEGVKRVAAASQWIKAELALGVTVAGSANYVIPEKVIRVIALTVGEDLPYTRKSIEDLWDLRAGRAQLVNTEAEPGVFAERFSADGLTKSFDVFPTPEEAGLPVTGLCSIVPDDLALADTLPFPAQHRGAVLDLSTAAAYERTDENLAQAAPYEKRGLGIAESLFLLGNARTGSGPYKIPVAGHRRR